MCFAFSHYDCIYTVFFFISASSFWYSGMTSCRQYRYPEFEFTTNASVPTGLGFKVCARTCSLRPNRATNWRHFDRKHCSFVLRYLAAASPNPFAPRLARSLDRRVLECRVDGLTGSRRAPRRTSYPARRPRAQLVECRRLALARELDGASLLPPRGRSRDRC